jgi:hypothetical protein
LKKPEAGSRNQIALPDFLFFFTNFFPYKIRAQTIVSFPEADLVLGSAASRINRDSGLVFFVLLPLGGLPLRKT